MIFHQNQIAAELLRKKRKDQEKPGLVKSIEKIMWILLGLIFLFPPVFNLKILGLPLLTAQLTILGLTLSHSFPDDYFSFIH